MNILLTTDAFPPGAGGSGRSTATLASALEESGHHVRVVVGRTETLGQREWDGVEVSEIALPAKTPGSRRREHAFASGVEKAVGEEAWDLVHAQHWLSAAASAKACPRLPLVVTVRDYWPVCIWSTMLSGAARCPGCSYSRRVVCIGRNRPLAWPVAPFLPPLVGRELARRRRILERARAVVAVSAHVSETLPVRGAHVIPNFCSEAESTLPRPDGTPERYLLFVGKLEPNKAPDRLVATLVEASCELPLMVAGTGRLRASMEADAKQAGLDVRFLGWVDEAQTRAWMQHAAAVLFPSRWEEPLSRVLIDGLGVGAVLVAEPTGGTEDAVVDGVSGLIGEGPAGLGKALSRVLGDEALSYRLREGARTRAREVFSRGAVLPRLEALYASVTAT